MTDTRGQRPASLDDPMHAQPPDPGPPTPPGPYGPLGGRLLFRQARTYDQAGKALDTCSWTAHEVGDPDAEAMVWVIDAVHGVGPAVTGVIFDGDGVERRRYSNVAKACDHHRAPAPGSLVVSPSKAPEAPDEPHHYALLTATSGGHWWVGLCRDCGGMRGRPWQTRELTRLGPFAIVASTG